MNADTIRAALACVRERPGVPFALVDATGKTVHLRFASCFELKTVGPGMSYELDEDAAADMLDWLAGPLEIKKISPLVFEVGT